MKVFVRPSYSEDTDKLKALISGPYTKYFGNMPSHFHAKSIYKGYQTHRFVALEKYKFNEIKAYAEIRSFPNIDALLPQCWPDWLSYHYCVDLPITMINTLFFNLFIFTKQNPEVLLHILREVFLRENRLRYLIIVKPPLQCDRNPQIDYDILEKYTITYYPIRMCMESNRNTQMIFVILRDTILPVITFRKALPEDNDDIIDMIDYEEPELRERLGDYFIAEELLRQDEEAKMQCMIVAEVTGKHAEILNAGFMWLSDDIKIEDIIRNFHLEVFGNLLIFDPNKPHKEYLEWVQTSVPKPYVKLFSKIALKELTDEVILGRAPQSHSIAVVQSTANFKIFVSAGGDMQTINEAYYQRCHIFQKFQCIYEVFLKPNHYRIPNKELITVCYNVPWSVNLDDLKPQDAANFFILNKFNLHPKQRMETTYCFLSATFSAFPQRDYLLVRLRPDMKINDCLNEILHYCLRIPPRPNCKIPYELFLTHRSSLFGEICIFEYCADDAQDIERFMDMSHESGNKIGHSIDTVRIIDPRAELRNQWNFIHKIMEQVRRSAHSEFRFFTIRCGNSTKSREETTFVGFVIMRDMLIYDQLHYQYILAPEMINFGEKRAEIIALKLHPFFQVLTDELFRMLAIKTNYFDYYHISTYSGMRMPNDLIKNMMPIEPRRIQRNWFGSDLSMPKYCRNSDSVGLPYYDATNERLSIFRHSLLQTKYFGNNDSIVIMGSSDYAISFLRTLVFSWNGFRSKSTCLYNCVPLLNVTAIVKDGVVESMYDKDFICDYCKDSRFCYVSDSNYAPYVRDCTRRMDLRNWVHFISGKVVFIDRANRTVDLSNKCRIRYDKLILMNHIEFGIDIANLYDNVQYPYNYSQINRRLDKIILFHKVHELIENYRERPLILLYGNNIATFACIQFLLTHGVAPGWIELVKPRCAMPDMVMTDSKTDESVQNICAEMLIDMGVKIVEEATFIEWILFPDENDFISHVRFVRDKNDEVFDLHCDLFINFKEDHLQNSVHKVFLNSGIQLNGKKIIVNENYCTNDSRIYAMGRFIEMKNKPTYQYLNTNQMEAAEKLMQILGLKRHQDVHKNGPFDRKYSKPYLYKAYLPKNYRFFKVTLPRRYISPDETPSGYQCSHKVMTTYRNDLCRIGLNKHNIVDQIMVFTKRDQLFYFLEFLCGKHEALLNNILYRFENGILTDFVKFINEPWTELFMHDMFDHLQAENIKIIKNLYMKYAIDTYKVVDDKSFDTRKYKFDKEKQEILENNLLNFVELHQNSFVNDFATPQKISS